jgi:hypothetical protein
MVLALTLSLANFVVNYSEHKEQKVGGHTAR